METHSIEETATPLPRAADRVDDARQQSTVNEVSAELHTTCNCTGYDGCGSSCEGDLEKEVNLEMWQIACVESSLRACADLTEANDAVEITGVHDAVAHKPEEECAEAQVHQVFEQNVDGVFAAIKTCFDECKPSLHEEDEDCTDEHGQVVNCKGYFVGGKYHLFLPESSACKREQQHKCGRNGDESTNRSNCHFSSPLK